MSYNGTVTTNTLPLKIRSGPSTATSTLPQRIPNGTNIVIDEVVDQPGGWKWGKVNYNGTSGYCCIVEPGVGSWVQLEEQSPPEPSPAEPPDPTPPKLDDTNTNNNQGGNSLVNAVKEATKQASATLTQGTSIQGNSVQYQEGKYKSIGIDDYVEFDIVDGVKVYKSAKGINDIDEPKFIQNANGFPSVSYIQRNRYMYDYYMDYSQMEDEFSKLRQNLNYGYDRRRVLYLDTVNKYNRFKIANPNNVLHKSFAHVFFIRPDLNLIKHDEQGNLVPADSVKNDPNIYYTMKHSPELIGELVHYSGVTHDFMFSLSNAANSFEISDEYVKTDSYGTTFTGYKIPIGTHNAESKSSGTFNIQYNDDRDLHIYQIHKIWTDYIDGVFRGKFLSKPQYIEHKIIDYASAVYYILTAEDGETIIFWSKYYGVFPTNTPSSVTSYAKGNLMKNPEFTINYTYAFKEDFNPLTLVEFNTHSPKENPYRYVKTYQKRLLGTGNTMVGAPFIETCHGPRDLPYTFKLRFRRGE